MYAKFCMLVSAREGLKRARYRSGTISDKTYLEQQEAQLGAEEAKQIADWLDIVRASLMDNGALSDETRDEVVECLSKAEAALRRASAETAVSGAILSFFKPN